jgi:dolichol-phosphate mannosyltransferase
MLSIVIPVFNEQDSLEELLVRIEAVAKQHSYELDVLLIDDGSADNSWSRILALSKRFTWARGIRLRRNFGKAAALAAGFERAKGERVITMDADLQDDPNEIPNLLAELEAGYDVVSGWKKVRHDPWHKVLPSRVFNSMISWLTGVRLHDHNCGLKGYRREVLSEVLLYGEMHRFIPVLAASRGFRVSEIVIEHHARKHGKSKYGFERFIKGFLDLMTVYFLTGYGNRPQHLLGTTGMASFLAGGLGLLLLSFMWVISRLTPMADVHLHEKAIFYYCIVALLLGVQLISMGFLAELITAQNRPMRKPFSIVADTAFADSRHADSGNQERLT